MRSINKIRSRIVDFAYCRWAVYSAAGGYRLGRRIKYEEFLVYFYDIETITDNDNSEVGYVFIANCYHVKVSNDSFKYRENADMYVEIVGDDFTFKITKYLLKVFEIIGKIGVKNSYIYSHNFSGFDSLYIISAVAEMLSYNENMKRRVLSTDH